MLTRLLRYGCLVLGLVAIFLPPTFASEPRIALVIGNSNYGPEIGKLLNPANDAKLMADTLKGLGFSVDLVLDADQKAMKRAIKAFGAKLEESGKDTTGLFYYAGHGVQVEGQNFLLPVGAEIAREADVEIESISAYDVMTQMQFAGNAVNLVFLDACRNNPLAKASRSGTRGLARLDAPRGSFVGYSTAPGDVAADGDGANSPYALALADELNKPGISVEEAHRNVRARVLAQTGNKQTPWDSSSLTGAVVLVEKPVAAVPQPIAQPAPQQQVALDKESLFWQSIKDSKNSAEFEAYLNKYPQGTFAELAKAKMAGLTKTGPSEEGKASVSSTQQPVHQSAHVTRIVVGAEIQAEIDKYLRNAAAMSVKVWALAIATDGSHVEGANCTPGQFCYNQGGSDMGRRVQEIAVKECGGQGRCILLFRGTEQVANVEVVAQSAATSADAIRVTADIQDEVAGYLTKADDEGRWAALAIKADGSAVGTTFCSKDGPKITVCIDGIRNNPTTQAQTSKAALKDCGAPGECILLYEGDQNVAGIELVRQ